MNKVGLIYKAISPSNKIYIGQTIGTLKERKCKHYWLAFNKNYNYKICNAIRRHGDNIKWVVIYDNIPINQLDNMERWCIRSYNSLYRGYNSNEGGGGNKGWTYTAENLIKRTGKNSPFYGKRHSKESKEKMSKALMGRKFSKEHKDNLSKSLKGKRSGENNGRAKLTYEIAEEMRAKYATGNYTKLKLAKEYGINDSTVGRVINNSRWTK